MGDTRGANPDQLDDLANLLHTSGDGGAYGSLTGFLDRARDLDASGAMTPLNPLLTWLVDLSNELRDRADLLRQDGSSWLDAVEDSLREEGLLPEEEPLPGLLTVNLLTPTDAPPDATPDTQEEYFLDLCEELGIDPATWDTSRGVAHNDEVIRACYEYYGDTFLNHPEVQWAGLGRMAGDVVYAGMQDMHVLRELSGDERVRAFGDMLDGPVPPSMARMLAEASEEELEWFEAKFCEMQKEIFMDLAWQFHAYDQGGIEEMRRLQEAGELTGEQLAVWEDIASGDPERMADAAEELARHEQHDILQNEYDDMRNRPLGDVITYMFSVTAASPVPDGAPFREVIDDVEVDLPEVGVSVDLPLLPEIGGSVDLPDFEFDNPLPLPTGNISNWGDRWQWVQDDILPTYQDLIDNDMDRIREEMNRSVEDRAEDFRLVPLSYDVGDPSGMVVGTGGGGSW